METIVAVENLIAIVKELRIQGRHLRDIGMPLLSHVAYRSAKTALRRFRLNNPNCVALCYCKGCNGTPTRTEEVK
jgi:hypothetical protein